MLPAAFDKIGHSQWDFVLLDKRIPKFPKSTSCGMLLAQRKKAFGWGMLARKAENRQGRCSVAKKLAVHNEDQGLNLLLPCKHELGMAVACNLSAREAETARESRLA